MATQDPNAGVRDALTRAADALDRESLWAALEPVRRRLPDDHEVAAAWAEALRTSPARKSLVAEATTILERWPHDPAIVGAACDALVRLAERQPVDEPPLAEGPGALAAAALGRCLGALDDAARSDPALAGRLWALRGSALRTLGPRRAEDAIAAVERALALDPERGEWLYDMGLVHKQSRRFEVALGFFERARALWGERRPVLWNVAIAATALGRSETAVDAWRALGIPASAREGELPFVEGLEPVQVRLPTLGAGHVIGALVPDEAASFEVVWVHPLSPCHGVIRTPSFREAVADFGDVILWDGAPVLVSEASGRPVPRFPLLGVLRQGDERRFRFVALQQREGDMTRLGAGLPEGVVLYEHGERVERVCPRCAAGERFVRHEHQPTEEHRVAFGKLLVAGSLDLTEVERSLDAARRAYPAVRMAVPSLYEALGDAKSAGAHHKRWGEIERAVERVS